MSTTVTERPASMSELSPLGLMFAASWIHSAIARDGAISREHYYEMLAEAAKFPWYLAESSTEPPC